jgi:probable F420-dependent oxidoreductase
MYDFRLPPRGPVSWAENAERILATCTELDEAGVDGLWLTEHHFTDDGYLPALMPMAAALAMRTRCATIGTSVLLAPLHDPLALAESAAVVDNLSGGRLRLGLGLGYRAEEFDAFGVDRRQRGARLDDLIEILRQSWSPGPLNVDGRHYSIHGVDVQPKPVQQPIPLWLAARSEVAVRRCGRVADGVILAGGPDLPALVRAEAAAHGRDPASITVACLRSLVVEECLSAAELAEVAAALRWRSDRYQRWYGAAADLPSDRAFTSAGTATRDAAVRSLATELDELEELNEQGYDYVIYHGTAPGIDPAIYARQWRAMLGAVPQEVQP